LVWVFLRIFGLSVVFSARISFLPVQVIICQAAETVKTINADPTKKMLVPTETAEPSQPEKPLTSQIPAQKDTIDKPKEGVDEGDSADSSLSTGMIIGVGEGTAVLLGGAIALGSGNSGRKNISHSGSSSIDARKFLPQR